jgi:F0F1-type ATP synthase alpha subunit
MEANHPEIGEAILKERDISAETEEKLKTAIAEFKQSFRG